MFHLISVTPPTLISEESQVQGNLAFHSQALIFGLVEGTVQQTGHESLRVGKTGWIRGNIESEGPVVVEGRVEGDIHSQTIIRLSPTATVRGNLHSPSIEILPGADIEGNLMMKQTLPAALKKAA